VHGLNKFGFILHVELFVSLSCSCFSLSLYESCNINVLFQFEKMGYTLGYTSIDRMRDYIYDVVAGYNRASSTEFSNENTVLKYII